MNGIQFRANRRILISPANFSNTAATSIAAIDMSECPVAIVVVQLGAMHDSADSDLTIVAKNNATATAGTAVASLKYRYEITTGVFSAWATVTDSKIDIVTGGEIDPAAADGCLVEIEVKASDLEATVAGYKYFYLNLTACGQTSFYVAAHAVLNNQRYQAAVPQAS